MKKIITAVFTAIFVTVMFCGCGDKNEPNGYRFYQTELSDILGMSKEELDSLTEQPMSVTPGDIYMYQLPHSADPAKNDIITLSVLNGRVIGAFVSFDVVTQAGAKSEHTICGIHAGDSKATAESLAESYSGTKSSSAEAIEQIMPELATLSEYIDINCYGDTSSNKGMLTVVTYKATGNVMMVAVTTR